MKNEHISNLIDQATGTLGRLTQPTPKIIPKPKMSQDIKAIEEFWSLQTFGEPELTELLLATDRYFADMRSGAEPHWLFLAGRNGIGKTHLARQIFKRWKNGPRWYQINGANLVHDGYFVDWRSAADGFYAGHFGEVEDWCAAKFVVLDDIGAERDPGGLAVSKLDRILHARLGKWTVITSNLGINDIKTQRDVRIASRLIRGGSVVVECPSTRDFNLR